MKRVLYLLLALAVVLAWRDWSQREITHPPGVLVPEAPRQEAAADARAIEMADFRLSPRARFEIRARVLSREDYRWDPGANLSPMDLALGWGAMSDESILERIEISQGARWYHTRYEYPPPLSDSEIIKQSGNVHLVPADALVLKEMKKIRRGHIIRARGYLIDAERADGFHWKTSLSRVDTGDGSCELFYVERLSIEN